VNEDDKHREQLGQMKQTTEWPFLDQALRALSWIGDKPVQQWFHRMRTDMTSWGSLFYLSVDDYVSEGGWELTPEGERRDLYFPHAYQLVSSDMVSDANSSAVTVAVPFEDHCYWCGRPLTVLLDLDLSHPALSFLPIDGRHLRLVMCEWCYIDKHLFMEIDFEGNARWSSFNTLTKAQAARWVPPDETYMLFTPPDYHLVLGPPCASPFEVVTRADDWDVSQLGGMPGWVQDAEYVLCPSCHRRMTFVGQVMPGALTDRAVDGVLYALICLTCQLSTVTYQCT
jgi:hypothetical protein